MVNFIERILRMPRVVLTVLVLLLFAGFGAYTTLPKESFPAIDVPYFFVSVSQSGVSPQDAERLLAKPIEDRLTGIDDLLNISSTSTTGRVSVFLEFDVNADPDKAIADIRSRLDGVSGELPDDATEPTVTELSIVDQPIVSVAVYGDVPERTLVQHARDLQDVIEAIPDVLAVELSGDRDEVLEVNIDLLRLEAYNLTANQLFDALARNNMVVAGGTLDTGNGSFNLQVPGLIMTAEDIFTLPLKTEGDTVVTFGDVATITRTFEDATDFTYVNGSPALILGITKKIGTNIIDVVDQVRAVTATETETWPQSVEHAFMLDQAETTTSLYRSLEAAVMTAVALVMITCVATLGLRPAILIGLSIPISFMMAFLVAQMLGMTINMMVMFGLVIAVGVLVDDPVVVVEYAERKLQEGVPKKEAFILAARKMFVPVVGATFTTLGAFIPLAFWPGIIGKFISYLPIIVIIVMVASLISALIFMPVIGAIIASTHIDQKAKDAADTVMYPEKFAVEKVRGVTGGYLRVLQVLLRHPIISLSVGFALIIGVFVAYAQNPTGVEAFPASEPEFGTVAVVARGNYSPTEVRDMLIDVQDELLQIVGVQDVIMQFGTNGALGTMPPDTIGNFQLQLQPWSQRVRAEEIFGEIRERVAGIPGLEIQIVAAENGPPAGKAINMRVEATDYALLAPAVERVRNYIENDLGNAVDVEDSRPSPGIDWEITIDRVEAARYGIGVRELAPYVQLVTGGVRLGSYRPSDSNDELDIVVRLPQDQRTFDALDSLRIVTAQGLIPVSNFIDRQAVQKVANISRRNGVYSMTVAAGLADLPADVLPSDKVAELEGWIAGQDWPAGVEFAFGGAEEQIGDANAFIGQAMIAAVAIIAIVLLLEYNSFYQVVVTLSTVVMSVAGVLLGMLLTGMTFSAIMTGLGIVALAGIVVKNGIVLIDTYNDYNRHMGVEPVKAMLLTAGQRVRPVLLTATVTALGVIPMWANIEFDFIRREVVVGGLAGSWFIHLSAALVSGLFLSTVLTLVMVPVMITAPSVIRNGWVGRLFGAIFGAIGNGLRASVLFIPGLFGFRPRAVTPEGIEVEIPQDADSVRNRYITVGPTPDVEGESPPEHRRDAAE